MAVLVAVASKHGATTEIAVAIGQTLRDRGLDVDVMGVDEVTGLAGYEAVVLGSGVYAGRWLGSARQFVDEHVSELSMLPVWLFSSGPIGDPPRPAPEEAVDVEKIRSLTGARDHRVFAGELVKSRLSFPERAIAKAVRSSEGDFRDWDEIAGWAAEIADALVATAVPRS